MKRSPIPRTAPALVLMIMLGLPAYGAERTIRIPLDDKGRVPVAEVVSAIGAATGVAIERPAVDLSLPTKGIAGSLTRTLLQECLGADVRVAYRPGALELGVDEAGLGEPHRGEWKTRLDELAERSLQASRRKQYYGMSARPSYRANDAGRPTVCLVHGLNSSSGGFAHLIPHLEQAGYGVVVFDYPFNQPIDDSCAQFRCDWQAFRARVEEKRAWAILAHSMGALVARSYVEGPGRGKEDVSSLILVAPVNQGAHVARLQPILQTITSLYAINGGRTGHALAQLSDGIGQAADDMLPGSPFLRRINAAGPAPGVRYHIVAGSVGVLSGDVRRQVEERLEAMSRGAGLFGMVTRVAGRDLPAVLDELADGTGDGCVAIERTRLPGVDDHVVIRANHAELIRAPLLFADDGPVPCMPHVLDWLREDFKER
ncbi:Alpha/beta hydrolase family protein [Aquisphaera giovannonii]|uniref:Alpha/beta hydrolase family protein n=1 Tax=Aquisphaera giovannonii TaxID=406548 RepID=A0A5B9W8A8_9BACT|nr:alpha/beta fold hydrolase [Aquisphaera giovannonii]QEH36838.1 Alpha/beta hydrolase family protein [Aquisphaera giovannonii]